MYRKNIAAAAAVLFLASSSAIPSFAAPLVKENSLELQSSEENEINLEMETETETRDTETRETQTEQKEAGFTAETETETVSEPETELQTEELELESSEPETEPEIASPEIEETFRLFQVDAEYALSKQDDVAVYEEMDTKSEKTGIADAYSVFHILSEEMEGWYYVESGRVRGFVKSKYLLIGKKAERYVKKYEEDCMETAKMLKSPSDNQAFLYTRTTAYDTLEKKRYAIAKEKIQIFDRIPSSADEEENEAYSEDTETLPDGEADRQNGDQPDKADDKQDEDQTDRADDRQDEDQADRADGKQEEDTPAVVGILEENGLCYVLAEEEDWIYVESEDVRGFVRAEQMKTGAKARREVKEKGEDSYKLAKQLIKPEDNRACYYTYTSIKEASVSGIIRTSMIKYAEQFLGNPYVWGGTSLTNGADCSGFVQSIYANFGYGIPRVAEDQAYCAQKIPVEDALPGDLIFYRRNDEIYHVVMSTGDGGTIEAKGSAYGIVKSSVNYDNAVWAVRIISDEDTDILEYLKSRDMASAYYHPSVIAKTAEYGSKLGNFKLTAYCSCPVCCGIWSGGPTASGVMPQENHTAAMADIPFGTQLIINGQVYTVEDRGTPYGHVDIYMNDHNEALQFGVQYAEVYEKK